MKKVPICLIIDDPAPVISVHAIHAKNPLTKDGRQRVPSFSNTLLFEFCDIIERHGIKGKFSVVPMPGNKGDIIRGIEGVFPCELEEWLDTVRTRVTPLFSIGPEMLSHHKAVDLATGLPLDEREDTWSSHCDRAALTPYIARALTLLKEAGFSPLGVTSPWEFGIEVEEEYTHAISDAVMSVTGSSLAWYFLHSRKGVPNARPWIALSEEGRTLVSIPATVRDFFWQTMDTTQSDDAYVQSIADLFITPDGCGGEIPQMLSIGGFPILVTHWQSLMSNGLGTGLRVLDEVGRRVNSLLSDRVEWMRFEEIMRMVASTPEEYPPVV